MLFFVDAGEKMEYNASKTAWQKKASVEMAILEAASKNNKNNIKDPRKPTEINTLLLTIPVDRRIMSKGQNKSDTIRTTIRFSDLSWQNRVVNTQCLI